MVVKRWFISKQYLRMRTLHPVQNVSNPDLSQSEHMSSVARLACLPLTPTQFIDNVETYKPLEIYKD